MSVIQASLSIYEWLVEESRGKEMTRENQCGGERAGDKELV